MPNIATIRIAITLFWFFACTIVMTACSPWPVPYVHNYDIPARTLKESGDL